MPKDLPYFKFYTDAHNSGNISICSFESRGLFTSLCALYWSERGKVLLSKAKKRFSGASPGAWTELIEEECIKVSGDQISITFLDKQFEELEERKNRGRENVLKGRWNKTGQEAPKTKKKYQKNTTTNDLPYNKEEKRREEKREDEIDSSSEPHSLPPDSDSVLLHTHTIENRTEEFIHQVMTEGSTIYTQTMLADFIRYWTEPEQKKKNPRLKYEREKTWRLAGRLAYWAGRSQPYACFLSDSEKTFAIRRHEFGMKLEPYLSAYDRSTLNEFYRYWTESNKDGRMRFEEQEFWDLKARLSNWKSRAPTEEKKETYRIPVPKN